MGGRDSGGLDGRPTILKERIMRDFQRVSAEFFTHSTSLARRRGGMTMWTSARESRKRNHILRSFSADSEGYSHNLFPARVTSFIGSHMFTDLRKRCPA